MICYSQCIKISFLILTPATLYSTESGSDQSVVFFDGELTFLSSRHLLYAVPAIFLVVLIGIVPPLLLLVYPLCYKVLAILHLEESKFTELLCKAIPLEALKPFFDSFQSSFKDKCRYFSGLYFIYRLSTLITFATVYDLSLYYLLVEIQFVLMLAAHSWMQPYLTSWHNKLDTFLFLVLAIVNAITLFRHSYDSNGFSLHVIQISIAYFPLLYLAIYCTWNISAKILTFYKANSSSNSYNDEDLSLVLDERESVNELVSKYSKKS